MVESIRGSARSIPVFDATVEVGPWLLDQVGAIAHRVAPAHVYAIVTDDNVGPLAAPQVVGSLRHYAPHARVILTAIAHGESHKTRETWSALSDWLLDERCGRDTAIIALGGGVVGDLAGFVAATFMRGVPVVQVPTTLLAMVDASVGGKVGVDTRHGKNLIGAFHQPAAVAIDPTVLQTLPAEQLRSGFAEVLKHGVIADGEYFAQASHLGRRLLGAAPNEVDWQGQELVDLVARSVAIKAEVVQADEREKGRRQVLNFGHTVAHALEACLDFGILHGHAVAIGMVVESRIAVALGLARPDLLDTVTSALNSLQLPTTVPAKVSAESLLSAMSADKKARRGRLVFALPARIGLMAGADTGFGLAVEDQVILESIPG